MKLISILEAAHEVYISNKFSEADAKVLLRMRFKQALASLLQGAELGLQAQIQTWADSDGIECFLQQPLNYKGPILVAETNGAWAYMDETVGDFVKTRVVKHETLYSLDIRLRNFDHPSLRMLDRLPGVKQALIAREKQRAAGGNFYKLVPNFIKHGYFSRSDLQTQEIH